jgi:hypothetical protein
MINLTICKKDYNKYVFQSMANIVTFLEYCQLPILQEIFEDDIEELLLGSNRTATTDHRSQPVLARFLDAIMTWDVKKDSNNFRLKIFSIMQRIIGRHIMTATQQILAGDIDDPSLSSSASGALANEKFHEIVNNELARLIVFTDILARNAKIKIKTKIHRPVEF